MSYYSTYRWCAVPVCKNTSIKTPNKLWVRVPTDLNMRKTWFKVARRDLKLLFGKTRLYFCEDHFDLEHDMENYMKYKIMGSVKMVRLKPHCIPSRFSWNKKHKSTSNESHIAEAKSPIISKSKDSVQDHTEEDNAKVSSSSCIENSQIAVDVFLPVIQVQEVPSPKHKANQASQKAKYRSKELQIDVKHKDEVTSPIKFTVSTATSTLNTSMEIDQDDSPYKASLSKTNLDTSSQAENKKLKKINLLFHFF